MKHQPYMPTPDEYARSLDERRVRRGRDDHFELPPERPHRLRRLIAAILIVILLLVVGYIALVASNVAKISTQPFNLAGLASDSDGRTNILVMGVGDPTHQAANLSDSMMVLSLDSKTHRVAQISLPRDMRVPIPGYGNRKINNANALGGSKLAEQTVSNLLGVPIHYYIKTNFSGLRELVNAVGGIDVDVKQRLADSEYPCDDNEAKSCGLVIEPGLQHMDGARALQYARCRKGTCGNDFGRSERQQEVISLVRQKVATWQFLINPANVGQLTTALRSGLETDMGSVQMLQFALDWQRAAANQPVRLVLSTSNGGYLKSAGGSSDLVPVSGSYDSIADRVQHIFTEPTAAGDLP